MTTFIGNCDFITIDRAQVNINNHTMAIGKKMFVFPDIAIASIGRALDTKEDLQAYASWIRIYLALLFSMRDGITIDTDLLKEPVSAIDRFDSSADICYLTHMGLGLTCTSKFYNSPDEDDVSNVTRIHNNITPVAKGTGDDVAIALWGLGVKPKNIIAGVSLFDQMTTPECDTIYRKKLATFDYKQITEDYLKQLETKNASSNECSNNE